MTVELAPVSVPDFGLPLQKPSVPVHTYDLRCREAYDRAGCDWVAVYADREHFSNIAYLCDFEPRFEEALLMLGPDDVRVIITGNECVSFAQAMTRLTSFEVRLCQAMSLPGQDRSRAPSLLAVLKDIGILAGQRIGLVGWKPPALEAGEDAGFFFPSVYVDALRRSAGDPSAVVDRTESLMHPEQGLRAIVDADQIAAFEWAASRATAAVWRIVTQVREGDSELEAAARMAYAGEPLSAHVMLASSDASGPVVGLRSPTARRLSRGDGVTTAVGYWGGLSARAGLISDGDDDFLKTASAYFKGLLAWYETVDIGVAGTEVFSRVSETLAQGGLGSMLNPGHLCGHEEWVNTPIRPTGDYRLRSGMVFQVDIIPTPMPLGWALNCEDPVVLADAALRSEIATRHPDVMSRIDARRSFMAEALGVNLSPSILPLGQTPGCLAPFWLKSGHLLVKG
ncbi:M24 family metallopeptidase [Asticcacaulis benevestitus]|uniref:Xaa-Pro aminopeptidase n=1 Tax=Asticcacaulis benevestitus DSM 16100 = ATCC BAA-896 TaxID=1121022 RepID=V4PRI3_9CAUL|nr:M24 family metallopeptidase [Asticcacaulis benevestitus]ESQ88105.1 hypothetical protein ABENE_16380 [Asticcacaulis benevestitus DSM 16100 = ATCC BAA-896]